MGCCASSETQPKTNNKYIANSEEDDSKNNKPKPKVENVKQNEQEPPKTTSINNNSNKTPTAPISASPSSNNEQQNKNGKTTTAVAVADPSTSPNKAMTSSYSHFGANTMKTTMTHKCSDYLPGMQGMFICEANCPHRSEEDGGTVWGGADEIELEFYNPTDNNNNNKHFSNQTANDIHYSMSFDAGDERKTTTLQRQGSGVNNNNNNNVSLLQYQPKSDYTMAALGALFGVMNSDDDGTTPPPPSSSSAFSSRIEEALTMMMTIPTEKKQSSSMPSKRIYAAASCVCRAALHAGAITNDLGDAGEEQAQSFCIVALAKRHEDAALAKVPVVNESEVRERYVKHELSVATLPELQGAVLVDGEWPRETIRGSVSNGVQSFDVSSVVSKWVCFV